MKKSRNIKPLLASILLTSLVLSGCGGSKEKTVEAKEVASTLQEKYAGDSKYEYAKPIKDVERDYEFHFDLGIDLVEEGFVSLDQVFGVYSDAELKYPVNTSREVDKEKNELVIGPGQYSEYSVADEKRGGTLFDKGKNKDWGNAPQYYLVLYIDLETGKALEKPVVTVFNVKHEIEGSLNVNFKVNEDGIATLTWNNIEGANEYKILKFRKPKAESGNTSSIPLMTTVATVEGNTWSDVGKENDSTDYDNKNFNIFPEDTQNNLFEEYRKDPNVKPEEFLKSTEVYENDTDAEEDIYFTVIALNDKGTSSVSNLIDAKWAASQTPKDLATYLNQGGIISKKGNGVFKDPLLLPSHVWVSMCDGTAVQKLITYDIEDIKLDEGNFVVDDKDENGVAITKTKSLEYISIPYKVDGTSIEGYVNVIEYDEKEYKKELKELKGRQDSLRDRAGSVEKDVDMNGDEKEDEGDSDAASSVNETDDKIYANSALSEYLAINMMAGNTKISLDEFNEASSQEYLLDAWHEAIYQNPLILGVKSIRGSGNNVIISYDDDTETMNKKQDEIRAKVKEVVKEIITSDMSDIEKEEAINDYLCANAEYDMDALDNAEKNNFKNVDKEFNDSFTAYGILINGKGVCAGYAAAFKLLADEAGLESIVVTGNLDGSLPHAWNRVKIDGEWLSLDVTNNDNEFISNGLFNLPDEVSSRVLVEDKLYMMDSAIDQFKSSDESKEYYRYNGRYYSQEEIVDKLVAGLEKDGKAALRTDYGITEEDFQNIGAQVQEKLGKELRGTTYLGVIYLEVTK